MSQVATPIEVPATVDELTELLRSVTDGFGERWRGRIDGDRPSSTYAAGVLHGLCIALAVVTGQSSDALLHAQMSGKPARERAVGEVRVFRVGGGLVVEQWDGARWERLP